MTILKIVSLEPQTNDEARRMLSELLDDKTLTGMVVISIHGPFKYKVKASGMMTSELAYAAALVDAEVQERIAKE